MTVIRVTGFHIFRDRHGKLRCYHRKTRKVIDLQSSPIGSAEFLADCARIQNSNIKSEPMPGTIGKLIALYRAHTSFTELSPQTKKDYLKVLDYLKPIQDAALSGFSRPFVVRIRDKAYTSKGIRFANYVKAVISLLFSWGTERGYIKENYASGIKDIRKKKGLPEQNRPWTDLERLTVLNAVPLHMKPAIALMMFTGLGPKDALTLPRTFYQNNEIATRRAKTGEPVFWQVPEPLAVILNKAPQHNAITLCANSHGKPWTLSGFRASWRPVRLRLECAGEIGPALTLYGLRRTLAVILREMGYDERTIADALGQKTIEMARHYARGADLRPKMRAIVESFDAEMNKRSTKAGKPSG